MQKRQLGRSGLAIAPLVLGGNVFGWTVDQAGANRLLDAFTDAGFDAIDTADVYSGWVAGNKGGESETLIGNWLKASGKRDRVRVLTKVGHHGNRDLKGLSKATILAAVDASLQRLQTDHIDLYQAHVDDAVTPLTETLEAFAGLIKAGKVRAIGASNHSAARLKEALATSKAQGWPRYETLQPEYNLYDRQGYEAELEPLCLDEGLGVISYYGLASGFLTGKYRGPADFSKSPRGGGMQEYLDARGKRILGALDAVSAAHKTSQAAVALAWLMARTSITAPIASASKPEQLKDFIAAAQLSLKTADIDALNAASAY